MILGERTITRRRYAAGAWSATTGEYAPGPATDTTIQASVQPSPGDTEQLEATGRRTSERWRIYTLADLRTADHRADQVADRVVIDGIEYEVLTATDHRPPGMALGHIEADVIRVTEGQS